MIERIASAYSSYGEATVVTAREGRWVHVSGQGALDASGRVTESDFEREATGCFERVKGVLERAGATMRDVVRITAYLTDLADYPAYTRARASAFGDELPASAAVQVAGLLAGMSVEIDAVAFVPGRAG
jgi:2-iminobutanoate/2-iminopropanoate deaminase